MRPRIGKLRRRQGMDAPPGVGSPYGSAISATGVALDSPRSPSARMPGGNPASVRTGSAALRRHGRGAAYGAGRRGRVNARACQCEKDEAPGTMRTWVRRREGPTDTHTGISVRSAEIAGAQGVAKADHSSPSKASSTAPLASSMLRNVGNFTAHRGSGRNDSKNPSLFRDRRKARSGDT